MLKVDVGYLSAEQELEVVNRALGESERRVEALVTGADLQAAADVVRMIYVDEQVKRYAVALVFATRDPAAAGLDDLAPLIEYGASTRASIYLAQAAQAQAFLKGRGFVTPQDVKDVALDVMRHRVLLSYEAEAEEVTPDMVIDKVLARVPVP
jgi:MoxR-like ATPase